MAESKTAPRGVHLVGSIPLEDNETVFRFVADRLGDYVHRIPDGETGVRTNWILWQYEKLRACPQLTEIGVDPATGHPQFRIADNLAARDIELPDLGYADAALDSWEVFARLVHEGTIPEDCRFQVSLPTPLATTAAYIRLEDRDVFEIAYGEQLVAELADMVETIPPDRLAIQWDTAVEFALIEGVWPTRFDDVAAEIDARLATLSRHVPEPVDLGYHLCYGDREHKHFKQPEDAGHLVRVANSIARRIDRSLQWLHLPVPRDRTDRAYVAPLADLEPPEETELYLGLVHHTDGVEGTRKRVDAASMFVDEFGLATECGWGRRDPETLDELAAIHRELAIPVR